MDLILRESNFSVFLLFHYQIGMIFRPCLNYHATQSCILSKYWSVNKMWLKIAEILIMVHGECFKLFLVHVGARFPFSVTPNLHC